MQGGESSCRVAATTPTPEFQAFSYLQQKHPEEAGPLGLTPWVLLLDSVLMSCDFFFPSPFLPLGINLFCFVFFNDLLDPTHSCFPFGFHFSLMLDSSTLSCFFFL